MFYCVISASLDAIARLDEPVKPAEARLCELLLSREEPAAEIWSEGKFASGRSESVLSLRNAASERESWSSPEGLVSNGVFGPWDKTLVTWRFQRQLAARLELRPWWGEMSSWSLVRWEPEPVWQSKATGQRSQDRAWVELELC